MLDLSFSLLLNANYELGPLKLPTLGCIQFHFLFGPINSAVCNSAFASNITEKRRGVNVASGTKGVQLVSAFYGRLSNAIKTNDLRERNTCCLNILVLSNTDFLQFRDILSFSKVN